MDIMAMIIIERGGEVVVAGGMKKIMTDMQTSEVGETTVAKCVILHLREMTEITIIGEEATDIIIMMEEVAALVVIIIM